MDFITSVAKMVITVAIATWVVCEVADYIEEREIKRSK